MDKMYDINKKVVVASENYEDRQQLTLDLKNQGLIVTFLPKEAPIQKAVSQSNNSWGKKKKKCLGGTFPLHLKSRGNEDDSTL